MEGDDSPQHWPKRLRPSTRSVELGVLLGFVNDPMCPEPKRKAAAQEVQRRAAEPEQDKKDKKSAKKDDQ